MIFTPYSGCLLRLARSPFGDSFTYSCIIRQCFTGSPADQITKARVSGNRVFVKSLTHEETPEEGEHSGWKDSVEAIESDEEREDYNKSDMFQRITSKPNLVSRRSLLTYLIHKNDRASALQNAASRRAPAIH